MIERYAMKDYPIHKPCGVRTIEHWGCEKSSHGAFCDCKDGLVRCPACGAGMTPKKAENDDRKWRECPKRGRRCLAYECQETCYLKDAITCPLNQTWCRRSRCLVNGCAHPMMNKAENYPAVNEMLSNPETIWRKYTNTRQECKEGEKQN